MVYVTGDTHGDLRRFSSPAMRRLRAGDTLIICGDFGFLWDGSKREKKALEKLKKLKYTILFVDGVHENYEMLAGYPIGAFQGAQAQQIADNIWHLLRGEIYTIEGETYFAFGGGEEEAEAEIRDAARTRWEQQMPSEDEMKRGLLHLLEHGRRVNYIVTHSPSGKTSGLLAARTHQPVRLGGLHVYLNQLEDALTFDRWFFGSLHLDKPISKRHLAVFEQVVPVRDV